MSKIWLKVNPFVEGAIKWKKSHNPSEWVKKCCFLNCWTSFKNKETFKCLTVVAK